MELNTKSILDLKNDKSDFSDGDLMMAIICTKCEAMYELNPDSIAVALMTNATIWDYIEYVQHSKCRVCEENDRNLKP